MIDRKKVIRKLEIMQGHINEAIWFGVGWGASTDISALDDAIELLKADQTYLQEQDEKIKKLHLLLNAKLSAQPLVQKLAEILQRIADIAGDYDNYPTRNGLEWVCIEIQEIAMSGLQEVKDEDT